MMSTYMPITWDAAEALRSTLASVVSNFKFWLTLPVATFSLAYLWKTSSRDWRTLIKIPAPDELPIIGTLYVCERDSRGRCKHSVSSHAPKWMEIVAPIIKQLGGV